MAPFDFRLRLVLFVAGILIGSMGPALSRVSATKEAEASDTLDAAVRRNVATVLLERRGATVHDPETDVAWVDAPAGDLGLLDAMKRQTFVALASPPGRKARDLWRLEAKVTPYGNVIDAAWIVNLTRTAGADDDALSVDGTRVATAVRDGGKVTAIEVRDLAGEDPARAGTSGWSRAARLENAITNLEQTGRAAGLDLCWFGLDADKAPDTVALRFEGDVLHVGDGDGHELAAIDLVERSVSGPVPLAYLPAAPKMQLDFLNWLADRGRGFAGQGLGPAWLGSGVELLKEVYFKANEVKARIEEVAAPSEPVEVEAPEVVAEARRRAKLQAEGAAQAWPPAPLDPMVGEREKGEGLWEEFGPDVVQHAPNAPPPFYRTFVRPDPEYARKQIHVVVWDPELVSLKMRAGTQNPIPQTGNRGDGRIPRDKAVLERVVGAFNGGFQTEHIWYGMMVDKKVLLPPRDLGATAGSWADGRTAFGTWEPKAPIPDELMAYRQNLPPLIEDGAFNPYGRNTWGWHKDVAGAVNGKTTRSALCYTYDGYIMYFYAEFANEHVLASTLFHCQCRYAIHLDMNRGHTGFELYRRLQDGEEPTDREKFAEVEGVRFQGSTMHPVDNHMQAPTRYLGADYRDYFYLTLRQVVPGADLLPLAAGPAVEGEGRWRTKGLPRNAEFPPRLAVTWLRGSGGTGRLDVLQLDPRALTASFAPAGDAPVPIDPKAVVLTVPLGDASTASVALTVGDLELRGAPAATAPDGPVARATVLGKDAAGFVYAVLVEGASIADAREVLHRRGIDDPIWMMGSPAAPIRLYQAAATGLVELDLGADEGDVVPTLTRDVPRLVLSARERPPRIVRLFPQMKPRRAARGHEPGREGGTR